MFGREVKIKREWNENKFFFFNFFLKIIFFSFSYLFGWEYK